MMSKLLERFQRNLIQLSPKISQHLALAVSGGSDSMALLMLAKKWAEGLGVKLSVLTVDHHLRATSREEADYVKEVCVRYDLPHLILDWNSDSSHNIQAKARTARYDLMTDWCHLQGIDTLLTAHHLDDQVENFFIRLSRASGLFGLLDHSTGLYNKIKIIRPLFNIPKIELQNYLKEQRITWYEDISNQDPKYLRSSVRQWLAAMPEGLKPDLFKLRLLKTQQHLRSTANYIKKIIDKEIDENVNFCDDRIEYRMNQDEMIAHMTLSNLLTMMGSTLEPPRSESLSRLIKQTQHEGKKMTLHGCIVWKASNGLIIINREKGRKKT